jgi:hypothetical protein
MKTEDLSYFTDELMKGKEIARKMGSPRRFAFPSPKARGEAGLATETLTSPGAPSARTRLVGRAPRSAQQSDAECPQITP